MECRHRQTPKTPTSTTTPGDRSRSGSVRGQSQVVNGVDPIQALIMASHPTEKVRIHVLLGTRNDWCQVISNVGLDLWCLMPLSTIFQLYRGSLF